MALGGWHGDLNVVALFTGAPMQCSPPAAASRVKTQEPIAGRRGSGLGVGSLAFSAGAHSQLDSVRSPKWHMAMRYQFARVRVARVWTGMWRWRVGVSALWCLKLEMMLSSCPSIQAVYAVELEQAAAGPPLPLRSSHDSHWSHTQSPSSSNLPCGNLHVLQN